jgi:eukaryotic translation initiation factor 2C
MRLIVEGDAVGPAGRGNSCPVVVLKTDPTARSFGMSMSGSPMAVSAVLLPPAKIQYANGVVEPGLSGTWNSKKFVDPAKASSGKAEVVYGVLVAGGRGPPGPRELDEVKQFVGRLAAEAVTAGLRLTQGGPVLACGGSLDSLQDKCVQLQRGGAQLVLVVLMDDCYGEMKLAADPLGLLTQCVKYQKIAKDPRGYCANLLLKINSKLGRANHTLASRAPLRAGAARTFQSPPNSISWLFDEPCMLVGIDVSHGETGSSRESVAAVVASLDGRACQYAGHITVQAQGVEMVVGLEDAMCSLFTTFKSRNGGQMPRRVVVFRDGVSDDQFEQVTSVELEAIQGAVQVLGYPTDVVKVAIVVYQKGHHTRLVYQEGATYINPCPGLCVDASGGVNSIASARLNEFYLNSHVAIQGAPRHPALPYPTLPYPTLPYPTLPYPTLPYPTLPYPTIPYTTHPPYPTPYHSPPPV